MTAKIPAPLFIAAKIPAVHFMAVKIRPLFTADAQPFTSAVTAHVAVRVAAASSSPCSARGGLRPFAAVAPVTAHVAVGAAAASACAARGGLRLIAVVAPDSQAFLFFSTVTAHVAVGAAAAAYASARAARGGLHPVARYRSRFGAKRRHRRSVGNDEVAATLGWARGYRAEKREFLARFENRWGKFGGGGLMMRRRTREGGVQV
ncbi:hypothetical protein PR202_ga21478 [Eleusine coracana subsp. coracana]|uniref:Uncharacterized protein n=1 Tax=Eleusine coracana subsp. coracana TaxID=191504 RepID=A0AAV5D165_ELECO|nr:hypothetical protein PR202_ga21478 [Eleusine coracana subsp. coracana]